MASLSPVSSSKVNSSSPVTPALLRHLNERKIMDVLRGHGPLTRAALVRRTGLSHPTVTKIVDALCVAQILEEGESIQPALGRPGKTVELANRRSRVFSLVIGTHRCSLISSGLDGTLSENQAEIFPTPGSYEELLKKSFIVLKINKKWILNCHNSIF